MTLELARSTLLVDGNPAEALELLQSHVRQHPEDAESRVFLFQLLCIQGNWKRALGQLEALVQLNSQATLMVQAYRALIQCEILREAVFAGLKTPLILGKPEPWLASLLDSIVGHSKGHFAARRQALEMAPASSGCINDHAFEWISDADTRLGPCFELVIDGKYYWAPATSLRSLRFELPADLRDLVWAPCQVTLASSAEIGGFMPVRYPLGAPPLDGGLLLARETRWQGDEEWPSGQGQRMLATSGGDFALLDCREILINPA